MPQTGLYEEQAPNAILSCYNLCSVKLNVSSYDFCLERSSPCCWSPYESIPLLREFDSMFYTAMSKNLLFPLMASGPLPWSCQRRGLPSVAYVATQGAAIRCLYRSLTPWERTA